MKGLNEFLMEDKLGLLTLDIDKLKKLPIEEFAERLSEDMKTFIQNHSSYPTCLDCHETIESEFDLVRYFGGNYHNGCFLETYEKERKDLEKHERNYFDLVKKSLDVSLPPFN